VHRKRGDNMKELVFYVIITIVWLISLQPMLKAIKSQKERDKTWQKENRL
jgi:hypothetical protein